MEDDKVTKICLHDITRKLRFGDLILSEIVAGNCRSKVHTVFNAITTKDGVEIGYVRCKFCQKMYKKSTPQTSNLVKHSCYIKRYSISENDISEVKVINEGAMAEAECTEVTEILAKQFRKWVIKECRSYNMIKDEGMKAIFKELVFLGSKYGNALDIIDLLPKLSDIANNVSEMYDQCFDSVKSEINSIKEHGFGLTTDIWTDNYAKHSYVVLTIHYLKNDLLTFRLLGLKKLEGKYGSNNDVVNKVHQVLEDFDCKLASKSIIVTTGDCDIFKTVPDVQTLPCISRLINNALFKTIAEVPKVAAIINACSRLVNCLKKIKCQKVVGDLFAYPSRWRTMYKMLNSIQSNWKEIEETSGNSSEILKITEINISHLRAVVKVFQPFDEAIETLEDDKNDATLHLVMAYIHELKKSCDTKDIVVEDYDFIDHLKKTIRFNLEKMATENITVLHKLALFLYPPTNKMFHFSNEEKKCVEDECIRLMKCFKNEQKPIVKLEPISPTAPPLSKRTKIFSDFLDTTSNADPNDAILQEMQYYKNVRVVNSEDFNPFRWWQLQKDNFPLLYKLSCTILATPATCAASRRICSLSGSLLSERSKQGHKGTSIEELIFINSNAEHSELEGHFAA